MGGPLVSAEPRSQPSRRDVLESLPTGVSGGRAITLAGQRFLAVPPALVTLFPDGGLRRGSVVVVGSAAAGGTARAGGTALALAILSAASQAGSWCAAVGFPSLGLVAASELGVCLERFALIPDPGDQWPVVAAALLDSVDVVLVALPGRVRAADTRRLAARARERGAVMIALGRDWPEGSDLNLTVTAASWHGLADGYGYLQARQVEVVASGRRAAARERKIGLWLPGPGGTVVAVDPRQGRDPEVDVDRVDVDRVDVDVDRVVPAASQVG